MSTTEEARRVLNELRPSSVTRQLPNARNLARFEMGAEEPLAGVIHYVSGPAKGLKSQCYVSAGGSEVIALRPKKVTKAGGGVDVGSIVLKVAWHGPVSKVLSFESSV